MPKWMMINSIDADPFNKGGVYIAGTRYKLGDYKPYLYYSGNYGESWTLITNGIPSTHFTRVVRADQKRKGLLYAGTEEGMYISFDNGTSWSNFQLNLPIVPITDLTLKNNNLIAATQGRSFWMIDDITPLHQLDNSIGTMKLFKPIDSYRMDGGQSREPSKTEGQNHPGGVMVYYMIKNVEEKDTVSLSFYKSDGTLIRSFSSHAAKDSNDGKLEVKSGMNRFVWNMRYPDAEGFDGLIMWAASLTGPTATPGTYKVTLSVNGKTESTDFKIIMDPRSTSSQADLEQQFEFVHSGIEKLSEVHTTIKNIRIARTQIKEMNERLKEGGNMEETIELGKDIIAKMTEIEEALYQTKNQSRQDPLNFPIRLNNKLGHVISITNRGNFKPTDQAKAFKKEVTEACDAELKKYYDIVKNELPKYNSLVKQADIEAVSIK